LFAAYKSIQSQREIARKRAATDFFLKTEMDRDALASHKKFVEASMNLKSLMDEGRSFDAFIGTGHYYAMRDYLNLLIAVGILNEVFDDNVCYDFWAGELKRAHEDTGRRFIEHIQTLPGEKGSYIEMVKLAKRWAESRRPAAFNPEEISPQRFDPTVWCKSAFHKVWGNRRSTRRYP
jgi:hypothetical protein